MIKVKLTGTKSVIYHSRHPGFCDNMKRCDCNCSDGKSVSVIHMSRGLELAEVQDLQWRTYGGGLTVTIHRVPDLE